VAAPKLNHAAIDRTIRRHWSKLRKKGVFAVRPGYAFTGGWITNQPAAVAIVDKKKKHVPPKDLLPTRIGDTAVDVQEAGPIERLRHTRPQDYARVAHGRPELRDKMEAGVDVRIILSEWENPPSLDALKSFGINTALVKLQNGVHNKGFVIDSSIVALGSQNFSARRTAEP
jgi:hypothetical protein